MTSDTWRTHLWPAALVASTALSFVGAMAVMFVLDERTESAGYGEITATDAAALLFLVPVLTSAIVGCALIIRRPRQAIGWLFLSLCLLILISGIFDSYAAYGTVANPGALPMADMVAVVADRLWISWLVVLTLILLHIPDGELPGKTSKVVAAIAVVSGAVALGLSLLSPYDGPFEPDPPISNPLELEAGGGMVGAVRLISLIVLHVALLVAAGMLVARFWTARDTRRRQLRLMALAAAILPVLVIGAFVAAYAGKETLLAPLAGCFVSILPITAWLAIERDHLFGIDRLVSRGLTYSLLTALLIACYATIVVVVSGALSGIGGGSNVAVAIATLATAAIAFPAHRFLQTALDKRFNRREYDALASIRRFTREPPTAVTVEEALRSALSDEGLGVAYWIDDRRQWVTEDGLATESAANGVVVTRRGEAVATVRFDESKGERRLVEAVVAEAGTEMENARLRAAITLQLREVSESRARIVTAQLTERHRLERNLHDGAQQRLLAVAFELRASEVSKDPARQSAAIDAAVSQLQLAVRELRDLANGLHPTALSEGGLAYALEDLASHSPTVDLADVCRERFPAEVEEAAWFIACEAVANAVKHAGASAVQVSAVRDGDRLLVSVEDDGVGGADPTGNGLRGILDRAEAVGGSLAVKSRRGRGTLVRAELPCASP